MHMSTHSYKIDSHSTKGLSVRRPTASGTARTGTQTGFTLILSVLIAGIVLAIGLTILNITVKEFTLTGTARESVIAFNAADAGLECGRYFDVSSNGDKFDVGAPSDTITCMGVAQNVGGASSGDEQVFQFSWGSPEVCTILSVTKFFSTTGDVSMGGGETCPQGSECTRIESRGLNRACADIGTIRTVERGLRLRY